MVYINTTGKHNEVWLDKPYATITVECPDCPSTEDAYNSGWTDGSEDGYHKGYQSGRTDGYDDGWGPGYQSGFTDGLNACSGESCEGIWEEGYDSGYTDAWQPAYDSGYTDGLNACSGGSCEGVWEAGYDSGYTDGQESVDCTEFYNSGYTDGLNACSGGNEDLIANLEGDYFIIPEGTTHLRDYAFYYTCFSSITIPYSVTAIGAYSFYGNGCLETITIPDSVISIGVNAFFRCINLTAATLGSGCTSLPNSMFGYAESLTGITIPETITNIGPSVFRECSALTHITFNSLIPPRLGAISGTTASLGSTAYTFPIYVPCQSLDAYKTAFGEYYAPRIMCNSGTSGVSMLDFIYETSAANQTIRLFTGEAQNDNAYFYEFYSALTRMDIDGVQVQKSENNIYRTYPRSSDWYFYTFPTAGRHTVKFYISREYNAGWTLDKLIFAYSPGYDGSHPEYPDAMPPCPIVEANIGETYEWLSQGVFQNAYELTAVTLSNSLKWVGPYSFEYSGIKEITIPDSVTQIRYESFYGTDGLFNSCSALTSATIGSGITDLKNYTFNNCTSLETVTMKSTTPPVIGNNTFNNCTSLAHIYVPAEAVEDYKAATNWSNYASIISAIQ